ncbi:MULTISPECIES: nuclear transport factor 2 family protein [Streptomyces]|jgi:limonene-1,2-epoxide hydrolase|uniref:Nuclear transport factor 2 family protein n=1 Tax=Streptomyces albidoflavus TaxID=1886 RepID=A0ABY3GT97_9ACTN|nr:MULTISPECIES: nuclear transport factor 2 family protein [Streptomyces]MYW56597.1 nuclear transport factor 2 family protein [Streptomyces sp. SID8370]MYW83618.1 nuclear transport factor 2 family protein [Streptomyces sp. SID8371]SCD34272.1 Limonene-1,2-epoxide hydrolase [Streptomyces sp. IgraMP-1]KUL57007.1 limonene-1,2-epoxide hydrolase [Streptomyces albidoflavus]MBT2877942.1 nuclear transport factor 2 family protein [Streptomyces sp. McG6]
MASTEQVAERFHAALTAADADGLRGVLADEVTFEGPVATASGVAECVAGLVEMGKMISGDQVEVRLADGGNVLTWSTVRAGGGPGRPTVTWLRVDGERITAIRTVFDARGTGGR